MTKQKSHGVKYAVILIGIFWVATLVVGFAVLKQEEFTPVPATAIGRDFPKGSSISLAPGRPTLVVFLHPYCPCSRATLRQLDELLAETRNKPAVTIVFTISKGLPPGWEKEDLWQTAAAMPGVRVVCDAGGVEARRFNVAGSGHTLLYDAGGRLLFSGGITASRGHEGDNPGQDAIVNFVLKGRSDVTHTPVFGCSLL